MLPGRATAGRSSPLCRGRLLGLGRADGDHLVAVQPGDDHAGAEHGDPGIQRGYVLVERLVVEADQPAAGPVAVRAEHKLFQGVDLDVVRTEWHAAQYLERRRAVAAPIMVRLSQPRYAVSPKHLLACCDERLALTCDVGPEKDVMDPEPG